MHMQLCQVYGVDAFKYTSKWLILAHAFFLVLHQYKDDLLQRRSLGWDENRTLL